ncbi:EscU/YscU/HrcU family type III secretion system export apparatus switch protein [Aminipila sp.]|jgi:flagellar biosynthesis protein|uniref:EscU/YscU/HrcU family type III secretion system export apparatus switch protein n=1 Tax=Aminipila sp. TaxID=2060095 RepID=UPI001D6342AA|nr:EscU/YscU/HrcU family type III secretion system export apparatus switch protein [Aminipila sp.]MBE6033269.1 type III secretion protein [Clostridiales bacterium]
MSQSNSTKKAVALKYDESQGAAPVIVASGLGHMAEKLVEVANQADVPVYEDTSLATVLSQLELGAQIPEEVYRAVVEIYVFFLKFKP